MSISAGPKFNALDRMPCRISDGPQTPEDMPEYTEYPPDEEIWGELEKDDMDLRKLQEMLLIASRWH